MADPLTAFSAAGTTLQLVEAGSKLLKGTSEVYSAKDGSFEEHSYLRRIVQNIQRSNTQIGDVSILNQTHSSQALQILKQANDECIQVSSDFLQLLDELKLDSQGRTVWKATMLAFRNLRSKESVSCIERKLIHARANLMVAFLICLSLQNDDFRNGFHKASTDTENRILQELQGAKSCLKGDIIALAQSVSSFNLCSTQAYQAVEDFRANNQVALEKLLTQVVKDLGAKIDSLSTPWTVGDIANNATVEQQNKAGLLLLNSLDFPERTDRVSRISPAYEQTFEWILAHQEVPSHPWDDFVKWFKASDQRRIYWVRGKAGSGKSTLMAFLDRRLHELSASFSSNEWTANARVLQAACYFWHGGTQAQRSLGGLLQSLIYQLCLKRPEALLEAVSDQRRTYFLLQAARERIWDTKFGPRANVLLGGSDGPVLAQTAPWTLGELKTCLSSLLQDPQTLAWTETSDKPFKFLLLIDGLDEFDGTDQERQTLIELLALFSQRPNVKICLSSRPWVVYKVAFDAYPQLRLEDLTRKDIEVFVVGNLRKNNYFQQMELRSPNLISTVTTEIIRKANGVFLWVRLVVNTMLRLVTDGCKTPQLLKILDILPPDLDNLFTRMMRSVNPLYHDEASAFMQIALCKLDWQHEVIEGDYRKQQSFDGPPLDLLHLFGEDTRPDFVTGAPVQYLDWGNQREIRYWLDVLDRLLTSRCMGLLEWYGPSPMDRFCPRRIDFIHRTARDFLRTPKAQEILLEFSNGPYDAHLFRCNTLVSDVMSLSILPMCAQSHCVRLNNLSCFLGQITHRPNGEEMFVLYETFIASLRLSEQDWGQLNNSLDAERKPVVPGLLLEATADWQKHQSTAMSLAILFSWTDYIEARITRDMICEKGGRPLLDYALIPCTRLLKNANPKIVTHLLHLGADPNEQYRGKSLWIRYLLSLQDLDHCDRTSNIMTIKALIQHGIGRFIGITDLQAQPSNFKIRVLKVNTLQEILKQYQTHRPAGFGEDAHDLACETLGSRLSIRDGGSQGDGKDLARHLPATKCRRASDALEKEEREREGEVSKRIVGKSKETLSWVRWLNHFEKNH